MSHLLPVLLGLAIAVFTGALALLSRPKSPHVPRGASPPVSPPPAAPRPEIQPSGEVTGPYAYDNGVYSGEAP